MAIGIVRFELALRSDKTVRFGPSLGQYLMLGFGVKSGLGYHLNSMEFPVLELPELGSGAAFRQALLRVLKSGQSICVPLA